MTFEKKFCTNCGAPLEPGAKFCGGCGKPAGTPLTSMPAPQAQAPVTPPPPATPAAPAYTPAPAAPPPPAGEQIVAVIEGLYRKKGLFENETVMMLVTDRRVGFLVLTSKLVNELTKQSYKDARAQGKGFFEASLNTGAWMETAKGRYRSQPPEVSLSEHPDNRVVELGQVRGVSLKPGKEITNPKKTGVTIGGTKRADGEFFMATGAGEIRYGVAAALFDKLHAALQKAGFSNLRVD
jgi:hypothetical protein